MLVFKSQIGSGHFWGRHFNVDIFEVDILTSTFLTFDISEVNILMYIEQFSKLQPPPFLSSKMISEAPEWIDLKKWISEINRKNRAMEDQLLQFEWQDGRFLKFRRTISKQKSS
jgi:hypothetical protein